MTESVGRAIAVERLFAASVGTLTVLTVLLMAIGLYSVIAYSVATRTQEIGVRMALGAPAVTIIKLFATQSITLVALGVAIGTGASIAFSRLLANWLFGVTPLSVSSYAAAVAILLVLGAFAAVAPARSATAVNPVDALRHQ
jgi:ABC-type antimicrobial peptide transport system permease subunit